MTTIAPRPAHAQGTNPPRVLFLHGAGGGGFEWNIWVRVFAARGWTTLAPDLQPSEAGLAQTCLADYIDQAKRFAAQADAIVGASLGGLLGRCAVQPITRALVLINALPAGGLPDKVPPTEPIKRWANDPELHNTQRAMPDADPFAVTYAHARWRDESGLVLREAYAGIVASTLPATLPIRVVISADDADVPPGLQRAEAIALGADIETVPGASHLGVLMGRSAAATAVSTEQWLRGRLAG